ncbi:MAG TPA: hypothetical protein VJT82_00190, partial [Pyrinomonadaceae bacterium]|nr:hypothetical protein [Pyrinomonadaceae bacterium]
MRLPDDKLRAFVMLAIFLASTHAVFFSDVSASGQATRRKTTTPAQSSQPIRVPQLPPSAPQQQTPKPTPTPASQQAETP